MNSLWHYSFGRTTSNSSILFLPSPKRRVLTNLRVLCTLYVRACTCVHVLHVCGITVPSLGLQGEATCSMTPEVLNPFLRWLWGFLLRLWPSVSYAQ